MSGLPRVCKMSGAGNDFVVLDPEAIAAVGDGLLPWVRRVCRRGLSVGADGVLLVEPGSDGRVVVRFYNPDGSEAFCGNGTRCAARFARLRGMADDSMTLVTAIGEVPAVVDGAAVRLTLPPPVDRGTLRLDLSDGKLDGRWVDSGVPHFVVFVDDLATAPLARWGPPVRRHPVFGEPGTNLDVVQDTAHGLAIRTWERGVEGETLSCGTGAVAAAFARWCEQPAGATIRVLPAGGVPLAVGFGGAPTEPRETTLEGDARVIFETGLDPEATEGFDR